MPTTAEDKRNKVCEICNEAYRDNTRPNNKKTCSVECGMLRKNGKQRVQYREENPYQPNQREEFYYDHHEYSFWLDNRIGRNQMWKTDIPYSPDKIQAMQTAGEMEEYMGGRKRRSEIISYNGDEKGASGVSVRFAEHEHKKAGEVTVTKISREEMEEYFSKN